MSKVWTPSSMYKYLLFGFFTLSLLIAKNLSAEVRIFKQGNKGIVIAHPKEKPWEVGDEVCFVSPDKRETLACGEVTKVRKKGALVKSHKKLPKLKEGDRVQRYEYIYTRRNITTLGVAAGFSYYFPAFHYQFKVSRTVFIGVLPTFTKFSQSGTSLTSYGAALSFNWYGRKPWRGFWLSVGAGYYQFKLTRSGQQETKGSPVVYSTIGWRGTWKSGFTIGAAAGAQYVDPDTTLVRLKLSGVEAMVLFDFGFYF